MTAAPREPDPSAWDLSSATPQPGEDLVAVGADLEPGTLLAAYRAGLFPMGLGRDGHGPTGWWSPVSRGVILPDRLRVRASLRRSIAKFTITVDTCFAEVVAACADPSRSGRWITDEVIAAYTRLHELGWAHSVETWRDGELAGGLYGVGIGGLFAGESMFHRQRDASKVALAALAHIHFADGDHRRVIDVQWVTAHLASLGADEMPRTRYLELLPAALAASPTSWVSPTF